MLSAYVIVDVRNFDYHMKFTDVCFCQDLTIRGEFCSAGTAFSEDECPP
jgi:hypothetical protein